jgi:hypothetical protein
MRARFILVATLLCAPACGGDAPRDATAGSAQPCLAYGPDTVRLTGTLRELTFPGPPNYEDIAKGDEAETGLYLDALTPFCTAGGRDADLGEPHSAVTQLQLIADSAGVAALRPHLGRQLEVRGTLLPAHTGHHHAPVLLDVVHPIVPPAP